MGIGPVMVGKVEGTGPCVLRGLFRNLRTYSEKAIFVAVVPSQEQYI